MISNNSYINKNSYSNNSYNSNSDNNNNSESWLYCSICTNKLLKYSDLYFYIDNNGVYLEVFRDFSLPTNDIFNPDQLPELNSKWMLQVKTRSGLDYYHFDYSSHQYDIHKPYMKCSHSFSVEDCYTSKEEDFSYDDINNDCPTIFGYYDTPNKKRVFRIDHQKATLFQNGKNEEWSSYLGRDLGIKVFTSKDSNFNGYLTSKELSSPSSSPSSLSNNQLTITTSTSTSTSTSTTLNNEQIVYTPTIFPNDNNSINLPTLKKNIKPNDYQIESYYQLCFKNTLLVLPTGMGKTLVSIMGLIEFHRLNNSDNEKGKFKRVALFLVDKIPLVIQQARAIEEYSNLRTIQLYGEINTFELRKKLEEKDYDVLVTTVGSFVNLLEYKLFRIEEFYFIVFDEVHHAAGGSHPFNQTMDYIKKSKPYTHPRILGLTASLINIENNSEELVITNKIKSIEDLMLSEIFKPDLLLDLAFLPDIISYSPNEQENQIEFFIKDFLSTQTKRLKEMLSKDTKNPYSDEDLDDPSQNTYKKALTRISIKSSDNDTIINRCLSLSKVYDLLDILQTSGPLQTLNELLEIIDIERNQYYHSNKEEYNNDYIEDESDYSSYEDSDYYSSGSESENENENSFGKIKFERGDEELYSKKPFLNTSAKIKDKEYLESLCNLKEIFGDELDRCSSKYSALLKQIDIVLNSHHDVNSIKILIFVESRIGCSKLTNMLKKEPFNMKLNAKRLVGHSGEDGMNSGKQERIIQKFRDGKCKLIVSTNVLEEGIDIQQCNLVICYDSVLSLKSLIQRRGRARSKDSKFIIIHHTNKELKLLNLLSNENTLNISIKRYIEARKERYQIISSSYSNWRNLISIINSNNNNSDEVYNRVCLSVYHIEDFGKFQNCIESINSQDFFIEATEKVFSKNDDNQHLSNYFIVVIRYDRFQNYKEIINKFFQHLIANNIQFWSAVNSLLNSSDINSTKDDNNKKFSNELEELKKNYDKPRFFALQLNQVAYGNMTTPTRFETKSIIELLHKLDFYDKKFTITTISTEEIIGTVLINDLLNQFLVFNQGSKTRIFLFAKRPFCFLIKKKHRYREYLNRIEPPIKDFGRSFTYQFVFDNYNINNSAYNDVFSYYKFIMYLQYYGLEMYQSNISMTNSNSLFTISGFNEDRYKGDSAVGSSINNSSVVQDVLNRYVIDKDIIYHLHCLESNNTFGKALQQSTILNLIKISFEIEGKDKVLFLLKALISNKKKFLDYDQFIKELLGFYIKDIYRSIIDQKSTLSKEFAFIKEAYITPSRIVLLEPKLERTNRAIRKFGSENFILVKITDESFQPQKGLNKNHPLFKTVESIFTSGITISNTKYYYVGNSNSQHSDFSSWFVNDLNKVKEIRTWSQDGSFQQLPRKFARGLSLMFSTTRPFNSVIPMNKIYYIDDINRNGHIFTEGCGFIGKELSKMVNEFFHYKSSTCAYQIRIGGFKGVLVVNENVYDPFGIYLRPSQKKTNTNMELAEHRTLEICSISTTSTCKLNRQIIALFDSLGIDNRVFFSIQDRYMNYLAATLNDVETSRKLLNEFFKDLTDMDITSDNFIRRILISLYKLSLERAQQKSHLEIERSRNLLGVTDPTEFLPENCVFIQIELEDSDGQKYYTPIEGDIMVCKNPCSFPGDLRLMKAVKIQQLSYLKDVIVFSTKGTVPNFKQISGGDLDGDRFFVCFDKDLLIKSNAEPYLEEVKSKEEIPINVFNKPEVLVEHFMTNVEKSRIGSLYNAHLAICDQLGAKDPLSIQLSIECFKEIDSIKTGQNGRIPDLAIKCLKSPGYPHYMRKDDSPKTFYQSKKLQGLMYDQLEQLVYVGDFLPEITINKSNLKDGYEYYLPESEILYKEYKKKINSLLQRYGGDDEESLLIGFLDQNYSKDVSKDIQDDIQDYYKEIVELFKSEFIKEFSDGTSNEQKIKLQHYENIEKKISAWYSVSYGDKESDRALGFYFIARSFKRISDDENQESKNLMNETIIEHMKESSKESKESYKKRIDIVNTLNHYIHKKLSQQLYACGTLEICGSTSSFLFEKDSNLNLHFKLPSYLDDISESKQQIIKSLYEELKKSEIQLKNVIITNENFIEFEMYGIDVIIGYQEKQFKQSLIEQFYIEKNPRIMSILLCILEWSIKSSTITSKDNINIEYQVLNHYFDYQKRDTKYDLTKSNLISLFLNFCIDNKIIQPIDLKEEFSKDPNPTTNKSLEWFEKIFSIASRYFYKDNNGDGIAGKRKKIQNRNQVYNVSSNGDILLSFFKYFSDLFGNISKGENRNQYSNILQDLNGINISKLQFDNMNHYFEHWRIAFHSLSAHINFKEFIDSYNKEAIRTIKITKSQRLILLENSLKINREINNLKCQYNMISNRLVELVGKPEFLSKAQIKFREFLYQHRYQNHYQPNPTNNRNNINNNDNSRYNSNQRNGRSRRKRYYEQIQNS